MKLTKQEIQFIDNYLIKNEVKYWDVRLEILDHIVSAVEVKIVNDGISFNEALLEVHRGFGNQFIEFGVPKDKIFEKGLYQSNIGFKKFTRKKQRELGRKYRIQSWKNAKRQLSDSFFLLEYICFIIFFLILYQFLPNYTFLTGLLVLMVPTFFSAYYSVKDKSTRKSLSFAMAVSSAMLGWTLYNLGFYIMKDYYGSVDEMPHIIFVVIPCLFYPFIKGSIKVYKQVYLNNKFNYNLKIQN